MHLNQKQRDISCITIFLDNVLLLLSAFSCRFWIINSIVSKSRKISIALTLKWNLFSENLFASWNTSCKTDSQRCFSFYLQSFRLILKNSVISIFKPMYLLRIHHLSRLSSKFKFIHKMLRSRFFALAHLKNTRKNLPVPIKINCTKIVWKYFFQSNFSF